MKQHENWYILEALASCAIEGNKLAEWLLELRKTNPDKFSNILYELGFIKECQCRK